MFALVSFKIAFNKTLYRFTAAAHMMPYLLPSDQEEVYGCQVDAELLAEARQQVPDGHAGPQRHRGTRAVR